MSDAIGSAGLQLQVSDAALTSYTTIANVHGVQPASPSASMQDVTTIANGVKQFFPTTIDPGEISLKAWYDPAEVTHNGTAGLVYMFKNRAKRYFKIIHPDTGATVWGPTFGYVSKIGTPEYNAENVLEIDVTIKLTAAIALP